MSVAPEPGITTRWNENNKVEAVPKKTRAPDYFAGINKMQTEDHGSYVPQGPAGRPATFDKVPPAEREREFFVDFWSESTLSS